MEVFKPESSKLLWAILTWINGVKPGSLFLVGSVAYNPPEGNIYCKCHLGDYISPIPPFFREPETAIEWISKK